MTNPSARPTEPTISVTSATRRLADTLFREAQEADPSLCQTHNNTFANFLSHIVRRGDTQQQKQQDMLTEKPHTPHGGGAFTDDADRFSHRCDEARVATAAKAHRIIQDVVQRRKGGGSSSSGGGDKTPAVEAGGEIATATATSTTTMTATSYDPNVIYLHEWRWVCRQHPMLLKTTLERAMPRSETTATALVNPDSPVSILPARVQQKRPKKPVTGDDDNEEDNDGKAARVAGGEKKSKPSSSSTETTTAAGSSSSSSLSGAVIATWTYATDWAQRLHQWLERFISGGIAGGVAKSVIAPGDRVKIIFQVNRKMVFSLGAAVALARQIIQRNGPLGLWAGHGATLLRVVPYASISFASFEFYSIAFRGVILRPDQLEAETQDKSKGMSTSSWRHIVLRFVCGASAGATATTVTYPLDLLRARYAAHSLKSSGKPYPSYLVGLQHIYRTEGLRKLYGGLGPTLIGIVPYAGASFTVFETLKAFVLSQNQQQQQQQQQQQLDQQTTVGGKSSSTTAVGDGDGNKESPPTQELATWQRLIAGALSGLVAQTLTYPLDIVRRRMQVHPEESKSMMHVLGTIYREEGVRRGLYKGLTMNWIKGPIAVAVSFTINDYLKTRTQQYHAAVALRMDEEEDDEYEEFSRQHQQQQQQQLLEEEEAAAVDHHQHQKTPEEAVNVEQPQQQPKKRKTISSTEAAVRYLHFTERLGCGALAGVAAKIWTIPFERIKLLMALDMHNAASTPTTPEGKSSAKSLSSFRCAARLFFNTPNPWQGTAGMLLRVAPFGAVSYTVFDTVQPVARRAVLTKEASFASDMVAGSMAAALATVVCHPVDVLRQRVALAESPPFASYVAGLKGETFSSLYVGLRPALMGVCPLAAFSFAFYHEGKRRYDDGSLAMRLALGAGAGAVGQVVSYPLNLVRRHALAAAGATAGDAAAATGAATTESIFSSESTLLAAARNEGGTAALRQMYRRMPMMWTFSTATLATSFAVHDWLRDHLIALRRRQCRDLLLKDPTLA